MEPARPLRSLLLGAPQKASRQIFAKFRYNTLYATEHAEHRTSYSDLRLVIFTDDAPGMERGRRYAGLPIAIVGVFGPQRGSPKLTKIAPSLADRAQPCNEACEMERHRQRELFR
jgi:hypothetical protein